MQQAATIPSAPVSATRRWTALAFVPLLFIFGALYSRAALFELSGWSSMNRSLVACIVLVGLAGAVMALSSLWLIVRLVRDLRALCIGSVASVVCGFVLTAGTLAKIIPCSGPS